MTDLRIKQNFNFADPIWDLYVRSDIQTIDEREELATAVRVALGTDKLADEDEILPDPDSTDRRGWWADMDAQSIWDGWPIGTKNWLLTRSKITESPSEEGDTLERARQYTLEALQPFIEKGVASQIEVEATRSELQRIDVRAIIYRGPLPEIDLRYQLLWEEPEVAAKILPPVAPILIAARFNLESDLSALAVGPQLATVVLRLLSSLRATMKGPQRATAAFGLQSSLQATMKGPHRATALFGLSTSLRAVSATAVRQFATAHFVLNSSMKTTPAEPPYSVLIHFDGT